MRYPAVWFDGETARPNPVEVEITSSALLVHLPDGPPMRWSYGSLRRVHGSNVGKTIIELTPAHASDERLRIEDARAVSALRAAHRDVDRKPPANRSAIRRALFWSTAAVGAVAFIIFVAIPALAPQIAGMIPEEKEIALGEQVEGALEQVGLIRTTCEGTEGQAALDRMTARLTKGLDLRLPLRVNVVRSPILNAIALPGGRVLIFEDLLDASATPEELAGVLAHEIGHEQLSHPLQGAIRSSASAGVIGLFFGDFAGAGALAGVSDHLVTASNTREAEREADLFAIEQLAAANASSEDMANFFGRLRVKYGEGGLLGGYLASHPSFSEREALLVDAAVDNPEPILSAEEWAALQAICDLPAETPDTSEDWSATEDG